MAQETDAKVAIGAQQYVPPTLRERAFHCPNCGVYTTQTTHYLRLDIDGKYTFYNRLAITRCFNCDKDAVWLRGRLVDPELGGVALPNPDLSDEIKDDYLEAAAIVQRSPRGAAALLRLCVQKLCKQLGKPGKNINDDIAALVKEGLPVQIRQALDVLRVVGNNAAHPGELDLKDDVATAMTLFGLINLIADNRISEPKRIAAVYNTLPEGARKAIEDRDKKQQQ